MNVLQKLADITSMVTYIKDHVDISPTSAENSQLDQIGATTLEIAEQLKAIRSATGEQAQKQFNDYLAYLDQNMDPILEQIRDIKTAIDNDTAETKDLYQKVEDVYVEYAGVLEQSTKTLEIQRETYASNVNGLTKELSVLLKMTKTMDEKIVDKAKMQELLKGIEQQLDAVLSQDEKLTAHYKHTSEMLQARLEQIQTSYSTLNQTLLSVDESFKTAVSRLDVLLMQARVLTDQKGGN